MAETNPPPIDPDRRYSRAEIARRRLYGLGKTQLDAHIACGDLEPWERPFPGSGKVYHSGSTILKHWAKQKAAAEREAAAKREAREAKGDPANKPAPASAKPRRQIGTRRRRRL